MKKKVAILTQPLMTNYGGILQNYALQYVLKSLDYNVETINRVERHSYMSYVLRTCKQILFKHHQNKILNNIQEKEIAFHSNRFISKYIQKVDVVNPTTRELRSVSNSREYDVLIVGSDQVWRPRYAINIYNDFFDFLLGNRKIKKIAYAASFGTDEWEYDIEQTNKCSNLAKEIDAISIREQSGVELCKKHLNVDATFVLDPTLLLDKEVYQSLIKKGDYTRKVSGGIYTYILDHSDVTSSIVNLIAKIKGLDIFSNQPKKVYLGTVNEKYKLDDYQYPPIEGWLEGFNSSDFVVTDSFHGTVFSIIFNKPFLSIVNEGRGRARFESLLRLFGLEHRLISSLEEINEALLSEQIDFSLVNQKREQLKIMSINFLKNNVQ